MGSNGLGQEWQKIWPNACKSTIVTLTGIFAIGNQNITEKTLWQPLDSHNGHEAPCGHNIETPDVAIVAFGGDIGRRNCSHAFMEKCRTPSHEFNADYEPKVLQFPVKTKHMSKAGS